MESATTCIASDAQLGANSIEFGKIRELLTKVDGQVKRVIIGFVNADALWEENYLGSVPDTRRPAGMLDVIERSKIHEMLAKVEERHGQVKLAHFGYHNADEKCWKELGINNIWPPSDDDDEGSYDPNASCTESDADEGEVEKGTETAQKHG